MVGTPAAAVVFTALALLATPPAFGADFNGDRLADFVIPGPTPDALTMILGSRAAPAPRLTLRATTQVSVYSSGFVGDVDGDGLDDLLVGRYLVFGRRAAGDIALATGGRGVVRIARGFEPRAFGDLDGDRTDDLVRVRDEAVVVVAGRRDRAVLGAATFRTRGWRVALGFWRGLMFYAIPAGDANGDHVRDLAIVVGDYWDCGEVVSCDGPAFVVFGRRDGQTVVIPDVPWPDTPVRVGRQGPPAGYVLWAMTQDWRAAPAGDFDGDGRDDLLFPYSVQSARSFVAYGRRATTPVRLRGDQASFIGRSAGWGEYAAPLGDVNGDGLDDVLVSLTPDDSAAVVLGRHRRGTIDRRHLGRHGWRIDGAGGVRARAIGDINGDRRDDVLIESERADEVVRSVILGAASTRDVDLSALGARGYVAS
jgi:hypothetical protein